MRSRLIFGVGLLVMGCGSGKPAEAPRPPAKAPLPVAPAAAKVEALPPMSPAVQAACDKLAKEQAAEIEATITDAAMRARLPKELGRCLPAGKGAWAIRLRDAGAFDTSGEANMGERFAFEGSIEPTYITEEGKVDEAMFKSMDYPRFDDLKIRTALVRDLDGDGAGELLTCVDRTSFSPRAGMWIPFPLKSCEIFTFTKSGALSYDKAFDIKIEDFSDVDKDGRPDILTRAPFDDLGLNDDDNNCVLVSCPASPPDLFFLGHSVPDGSFSFTDEAAAAYAKRQCPAAPAEIFDPDDQGLFFDKGAKNFACALLWNTKTATLRAEVLRARRTMCRNPDTCGPFLTLLQILESKDIPLPRLKP